MAESICCGLIKTKSSASFPGATAPAPVHQPAQGYIRPDGMSSAPALLGLRMPLLGLDTSLPAPRANSAPVQLATNPVFFFDSGSGSQTRPSSSSGSALSGLPDAETVLRATLARDPAADLAEVVGEGDNAWVRFKNWSGDHLSALGRREGGA